MAFDLWYLFVEQVFGGFHLAVFGIAFVFLIIMMMGGVSILTNLWYNTVFIGVMYMGYGPRLIPAMFFMIALFYAIMQAKGFFQRSGGDY